MTACLVYRVSPELPIRTMARQSFVEACSTACEMDKEIDVEILAVFGDEGEACLGFEEVTAFQIDSIRGVKHAQIIYRNRYGGAKGLTTEEYQSFPEAVIAAVKHAEQEYSFQLIAVTSLEGEPVEQFLGNVPACHKYLAQHTLKNKIYQTMLLKDGAAKNGMITYLAALADIQVRKTPA